MRSVGEVVAIHVNNQPSVYARIEAIEADVKPRWFQVRLLFLSFPPQEATWILRAEYIDGAVFTMNDVPVQIVPVKKPDPKPQRARMKTGHQGADVISMNRARTRKVQDRTEE